MTECKNCGKPYNVGDEVCQNCGYVFPFSTDVLTPGTILQARYEIQELYHSGGMGYIYLAKDKRLYDQLCIVKQVKERVKSDHELLKKLQDEALNMTKLKHTNVARILDHFTEGDYYFLVVDYIEGKTLSEIFRERKGQLTEEEVLNWAISICEVLSYIHKQGIIHRDISPDNIMLTDEGSIKFIDFGTLRELRHIASKGTAGMGKVGYTPPEQWLGKPSVQSDVFALGATIYYLLSGFLPLSQEYLIGQGVQGQDLNPDFPPIRQKNPQVSSDLEAALQRALQLSINRRYSSATEFGEALRSLTKAEVKEAPVLKIDTDRLEFTDVEPGKRAIKSFTIKNIGTGRLTGKVTTTQPWLKVPIATLDLAKGIKKVRVIVDTTGLDPGFYGAGEINITTNAGRVKITITLSTIALINPMTIPMKLTRVHIPRMVSHKKWLLLLIFCLFVLVPLLVIGSKSVLFRNESDSGKMSEPTSTSMLNAEKDSGKKSESMSTSTLNEETSFKPSPSEQMKLAKEIADCINHGIALIRDEQYKDGISELNKASDLLSESTSNVYIPYLYFYRGYAYLKIGEKDKALTDLNKAIELNPNQAIAYYYRGFSYLAVGNILKAKADLERCIELSQDSSLTQDANKLLDKLRDQ